MRIVSIDADGTVYPVHADLATASAGGNAATDGVAAAWRALHDHPCVACYSTCLVEQNFLHSLQPSVAGALSRAGI